MHLEFLMLSSLSRFHLSNLDQLRTQDVRMFCEVFSQVLAWVASHLCLLEFQGFVKFRRELFNVRFLANFKHGIHVVCQYDAFLDMSIITRIQHVSFEFQCCRFSVEVVLLSL